MSTNEPNFAASIEDAVVGASEAFAKSIDKLASEPYLRDAILRMAIREVTWSLYELFPDSTETLHDQLGAMGMAVQSRIMEA